MATTTAIWSKVFTCVVSNLSLLDKMFVNFGNTELPRLPEHFVLNSNEFLITLKDPKSWAAIPLLNYTPLHELKDISIVRFRGMIQDMHDPEIYLERYEVNCENGTRRIQEGKYRDCLVLGQGEEIKHDSEHNVQGERRTLFVVSIPGLNPWAKIYEEQYNTSNIKKQDSNCEINSNEVNRKRQAADDDMDVDKVDNNKRLCQNSNTCPTDTRTISLNPDYLLNSPIPERPGKACMVKIYDDFDLYALNTVVDVVGYLSVDPALSACAMDEDELSNYENLIELQAQNPPPSLIPRLHAVALHKLTHLNPLLDARFALAANGDSAELDSPELNMLSVQKDLKMLLTLCLFNDDLAADYLLSHMISTIYNRSDFESIGKCTLNICNIPQSGLMDYTKKLYEILELLMPASHYLAMSLDNMNSFAFAPKKDYETNKLVSGLLQLAPHTHLILDETQMQQGKLEENGVKALQSLAYLIKQQQIKCDFRYYEIDYNTDIPVLVLSEGRSMLPSDFIVPLKSDVEAKKHIAETFKAAHHYLQSERLDQFRRFLTKAKISDFTMNPEDSEMIQEDFVEMRKNNAVSSTDDLHSLLVLSRLLAISRGKNVLDKESWELAKAMETNRKLRVEKLPKSRKI